MPRLTFQSRDPAARRGRLSFVVDPSSQKFRPVGASTALPIAPKRFGHNRGLALLFLDEILEKQFGQPRERNGIGSADAGVEPVAQPEEGGKWRGCRRRPADRFGLRNGCVPPAG